MEQYKTRIACASTEPEPRPVISMGEFFKEITIDLWDPFALIFFILNTLHLLENGDYQYCYCKERKSEQKDFCQICKIPDILYGFESFVYKHRFDILALRKYYFRLKNELIKCFYHSPRSTQAFLGENTTSVVETGTQANTGEFLLEKAYDIQTQFFSQKIRDKKRAEKYGPF